MTLNVTVARAEALFCSTVQPSEHPSPEQITSSIAAMARTFGCRCCAEQVAQEFGEHPETAVARMRWARELVSATYQTHHT